MKKIVLCFLFIMLALVLCACGGEEIPDSEINESTAELETFPEPAEEQNKEELYEEIILNFGARKQEDGSIRINKTVSLYNITEGFEDGTKLNENSYFGWAIFYLGKEYDYETQKELFTGARENMGWAYPSEYYEPAVFEFFGVPAETLRAGELYNSEKDYYHLGGGGGVGISPLVVLKSDEENGDTVIFHITLDYQTEGWENENMALAVKLLPDGGYNYVSYLPEEAESEPEEKVSAFFAMGEKGEPIELSVGDTIGEWVLAELSVNCDSNGDMNKVRARFEGNAIFEGYIERDVLLEEAYDFVISESETERMPYLVSKEFEVGARVHYLLSIPEELETKPSLDWNMISNAKVEISGFTLSYAFTMTADRFDVTDIKMVSDGISPIYEDMLINFGAEKGKDGKLYPSDGFFSGFMSLRGFADTKSITDAFYYNWYFNHMHKLDISREELEKTFVSPLGGETGWAYPAEYFEPAAEKFFGVSAEELRKRDFYYEEQDCYYVYTGAPGIGEIPEIVVNKIEDKGDIIFHLIIDYNVQEDFCMALTVRYTSDGGYNYVSYLPE